MSSHSIEASPDERAAKRIKTDASPAHDEGIEIVAGAKTNGHDETEALKDVTNQPANNGDAAATGVASGSENTVVEAPATEKKDGETPAAAEKKDPERKVDARDAGTAPIKSE